MCMNLLENFQWSLDVDEWELSDSDINLLLATDMLQEYKWSIRQCSINVGISKSVLHNFISNGELKRMCFGLYQLCKKQLKYNKIHPNHFRKFKNR